MFSRMVFDLAATLFYVSVRSGQRGVGGTNLAAGLLEFVRHLVE